MASSPKSKWQDSRRVVEAVFAGGLLALIALVLILPVFPSGDGPVHIYFSRILYLLATRQGGVYSSVYFVRHLIQPYSLHYFWLIGFERVTSTAIAEKSFVVAILLVNALGFRMLARQLGDSATAVSPWILPLLLSWALGSGFLNFCFAAGVLFVAYALYLRLSSELRAGPLAAYVAALLLLVLSHPVPLLMLLLLLVGDGALLLWNKARVGHTEQRASGLLPLGVCFVLACFAFIFPMLIADKASVADSLLRDLRPHASQVLAICSGDRLSLFFAATVAGVLFTATLVALVPAAATLVARSGAVQRFTKGVAEPADRLCLTALVLLGATIIFPQSMNGSALFADRMVPLLWPLVFACAAAVPMGRQTRRWSTSLAMLATVASLAFAWAYLLPAARQQQELTEAQLPRDARGLFIAAPAPKRPFTPHLAGQLLAWGGARAFAAHNDVLLNSPWMQLTIVPVGERGRAGLLRDQLAGSFSENPIALGRLLQTHSESAARALANADFVLYSDPAGDAAAALKTVATLLPDGAADWRCEAGRFYAVCVRRGTR